VAAPALGLAASTRRDISLVERIPAAAGAGFTEIGVDYRQLRASGHPAAAISSLAARHGVRIVEVELLGSALEPDGDAAVRFAPRLFAMATALGARRVISATWRRPAPELAGRRFAELCDMAADHGLTLGLEFAPWTEVPDLPTAWDIVRRADRVNAGIVLDTWHFFRAGTALSAVDELQPGAIACIQVSDGPPPVAHLDPYEETRRCRLAPGAGTFDLVGLFRRLAARGVSAPWSVEVLTEGRDQRDAVEALAEYRRAGIELRRRVCERNGRR
jgi:sugar phosphate isomerase/epimerase